MTEEKTLLLKSLMDALHEGIISMDIQGNITYVNKGVVDILGYKSFNLIGRPVFDFVPSFARGDIMDIFKQLEVFGTVKDRKIQLYDVKGQLHNLKISLSLLRDKETNPVGIISTIKDVKDVTVLEKELEKLQEFSQSILNNAGVGIIATDLKGDIIFASKGTKDIFNQPLGRIVGQNVIKNSPNPLILNEKFNNLIKTGNSFEYESEIPEKEKVRNFINIFTLLRDKTKTPVGVIVVFKDISKLKEMEMQLKNTNAILRRYTKDLESLVEVTRKLGSSLEQEKIYRIIAKTSKKILNVEVSCFFKYSKTRRGLILNSAEGIELSSLRDIDPQLVENGFYPFLLNLKAPKIIPDLLTEKSFRIPPEILDEGLKSAVFVPVFSKDTILGVLAVFLKDYKKFKKEEIEILQSIGNSGAMAIENAILYNEIKKFALELEKKVEGRTVDLMATNEQLQGEIEERKRIEAELERSNTELQQFAYVASHDLQEPLRMVTSYVQLLARRYEGQLDADADDFIGYAVDGAVRMQKLIDGLLTYSRVGTCGKDFEPVDCETVIDQVLTALQIAIEESGAVITHDPLPTVMADDLQLGQLFQNLIGNAIKFHDGGPPQVHISAERKGDECVLSVRDSGIGIDPEYADRIFMVFQRLHSKEEYPGTGIGLAVCKRIVERHGGRIWVESKPGNGATFYFTILMKGG